MTNLKPYQSPQGVTDPIPNVPWRLCRRIPALIVASAIASVPYFGYFVHASRDPQWIAIVIALCWLINGIGSIVFTVLAVAMPITSQGVRRLAILLTVYLWIACLIGWGGVGKAVLELLAG